MLSFVNASDQLSFDVCAYSVANSWQNFPASPAEKFGR
jgi:hypothetical protein